MTTVLRTDINETVIKRFESRVQLPPYAATYDMLEINTSLILYIMTVIDKVLTGIELIWNLNLKLNVKRSIFADFPLEFNNKTADNVELFYFNDST